MMEILADTVLSGNGEVIGVIPGLLRHEEVEHSEVSKMIVTKTMSKRKVKISRLVDGYIGLPGGFGTLDEIFEELTLSYPWGCGSSPRKRFGKRFPTFGHTSDPTLHRWC